MSNYNVLVTTFLSLSHFWFWNFISLSLLVSNDDFKPMQSNEGMFNELEKAIGTQIKALVLYLVPRKY